MNQNQKNLNIVKKMTEKTIIKQTKKVNKLNKKISFLLTELEQNKRLHRTLTNEIHGAYANMHRENADTGDFIEKLDLEIPKNVENKAVESHAKTLRKTEIEELAKQDKKNRKIINDFIEKAKAESEEEIKNENDK